MPPLRLMVASPWVGWAELQGTECQACAVAVPMVAAGALNVCEGGIPADPLNMGGPLMGVSVLTLQIY